MLGKGQRAPGVEVVRKKNRRGTERPNARLEGGGALKPLPLYLGLADRGFFGLSGT